MNYRIGVRIHVGGNRWFEFGGQVIADPTITKEEIAKTLWNMEVEFNEKFQDKRMHTSFEETR